MTHEPVEIPVRHRALFSSLLLAEHFLGTRIVDAALGRVADALQRRVKAELAAHGPAQMRDVERRRNLAPREFHEKYLRHGIPVLLEGAARDWPCTQTWSLDYFRQHYGDHPILRGDLEGFDHADDKWIGPPQESTLGAAIDEMRAGQRTYVRFGTVVDEHPELQAMLDLPALEALRNPGSLTAAYNFFIGGAGTSTQAHCALLCNLFVMVNGRKRWTLYPARSAAALRPRATRGQYFYSEVDLKAPDPERFPAVPYLDGYRLDLEPGDILYIPPYMWHHVENLTDSSVGVGYRFTHVPSTVRASATLLALRLFAFDPPPWVTLAAMVRSDRIRSMVEYKTAPRSRRPSRGE